MTGAERIARRILLLRGESGRSDHFGSGPGRLFDLGELRLVQLPVDAAGGTRVWAELELPEAPSSRSAASDAAWGADRSG
jgi:hypothetical protein